MYWTSDFLDGTSFVGLREEVIGRNHLEELDGDIKRTQKEVMKQRNGETDLRKSVEKGQKMEKLTILDKVEVG